MGLVIIQRFLKMGFPPALSKNGSLWRLGALQGITFSYPSRIKLNVLTIVRKVILGKLLSGVNN